MPNTADIVTQILTDVRFQVVRLRHSIGYALDNSVYSNDPDFPSAKEQATAYLVHARFQLGETATTGAIMQRAMDIRSADMESTE